MPSLIGNKPNQVPSNGDLGTLAFQDGVVPAGDIVGTTATQTLTNKTLTSPIIGTGYTAPNATGSTTFGFKNRIINGAMVIDQRNAGASVSAGDGAFGVDRFSMYYQTGISAKGTIQQNAGSVTPPAGFSNYVGFTSNSAYSVASGDAILIHQRVEGYNIADLAWGTANAKTVTLSFWVRSSLTGTFGGTLRNAGATQFYPFSYTISSANTWEYKTITIAGSTTGTWNSTNGIGIYVMLGLGVGSSLVGTANAWSSSAFYSPTGATSVVGTNGATFYITGVQLEVGSTATSFDYRPYGTELALCQRYYQRMTIASNTGTPTIGSGSSSSSTTSWIENYLPVTMRAAPTIAFGGSPYITDSVNYNLAVSSIGAAFPTPISVRTNYTHSSGATTNRPAVLSVLNNGTAYIDFSAEL